RLGAGRHWQRHVLPGGDRRHRPVPRQAAGGLERAAGWLADARKKHPGLVEREFNYRGHKVAARYTDDRLVSSFVVRHDDYFVYSTSHRAVRKVIDAATGKVPRLHDAADYRYVTTLLPPAAEAGSGYFFASEAFLRRMVGPQAKISER